jgi:putative ABC transport system permease protein
MLKNYLKVTLRSLLNNYSHTTINVLGLTLGIAGAILIFIVVAYSMSFDNYHAKGDRVYRVVTQSKESTGYSETSGVPVPLTEAVVNYFPEVELGSFVSYPSSGLVSLVRDNGETEFFPESSGVVYLDSNFYKIFDRAWIVGDAQNAFREANSVVLSEKIAKKYFNSTDVLNKTIRLNNKYDLQVSGVMEDFPINTQFPFDVMVSYETVRAEKAKEKDNAWGSIWSDEQSYVLLNTEAKAENVNTKFPEFVDKHYPQTGNFPNTSKNRFHWLQPLDELHSDSRFGNYSNNTTSTTQLMAMGAIGFFLLITAAINFINLSTALAINRSKEVGIRKVVGSSRFQLIAQFMGETFLITLIALVFSIGLAEIVLSQVINPFLELNLSLNVISNFQLIGFLILVLIGVSFLSGFYPSLVVSGFKPVHALKNSMSSKSIGGFPLRKALVVFQFVITQILIICTIVVLWQTQYMQQFDMGFSREAIAVVNLPISDANKIEALKNELSNHSSIQTVSVSAFAPASGSTMGTGLNFVGESQEYGVQMKMVDPNYLELYKIKLLSGKNIIVEDTARRILVNETFVKHVGMDNQSIVGREVSLWGKNRTIDGVVNDFHTNSLQQQIEPVILFYNPGNFNLLGFQVALKDWETVKKFVEEKWKGQYSGYAMELRFLDDDIANFYEGEKKMGSLVMGFCGVAIFIGCIGLYGLVMFMSKMKTKEVGIRKTLGASVMSIMNMFSLEFTKLVLIAFAIASPVAWWVMNQWLSQYSIQIDLGWQVFVLGLVTTVVIALTTVAHRSFKSAVANPVDSLRSE